jgi:acetate kinase
MPEEAQVFALPRQITATGVRRYGFHGLSYEYIADTLPEFLGEMADGRVVIAHLGNGVSLCAINRRVSIATTMSFSPLDGIPMATRSGALDPGAMLYLQQTMGMDVDEVAQLLNYEAGLLGVSGISGDMRRLLASAEPDAREAIELFVYHVVRAIGSLAAALSGIDALVFTAGIGENAATIREQVCKGCAWLGIAFDPEGNVRNGPCISRTGSPVSAWVIPTDEEIMIARHTLRLLPGAGVAGR